jgi:hypothetical protein
MLSSIIDPRIDGVNERGDCVLRTFEVIGQDDVAIFISVSTFSNLQLPFCKLALFNIICVQSHVDFEMKDFDVLPENGALEACTNHLRPRTPLNDRQDLVKVTSKHNRDATKWMIRVKDVF